MWCRIILYFLTTYIVIKVYAFEIKTHFIFLSFLTYKNSNGKFKLTDTFFLYAFIIRKTLNNEDQR